jgi:hypothetical protein
MRVYRRPAENAKAFIGEKTKEGDVYISSLKRLLLMSAMVSVPLVSSQLLMSCKGRPAKSRALEDANNPQITNDGLKSWKDGKDAVDWDQERTFRDAVLSSYLYYDGADSDSKYGFRAGQNPKMAWKWFEEAPVGFNGVPFVILKTLLNLDASYCSDPAKLAKYNLCEIYKIWHKDSLNDGAKGTVDHIGVGAHPDNYDSDGKLTGKALNKWPLPYGLVIQAGAPNYDYSKSPFEVDVSELDGSNYKDVRQQKYAAEQGMLAKAYASNNIADPKALPKDTLTMVQYKTFGAGLTAISAKLAQLKGGLDANALHIADVAKTFEENNPVIANDGNPYYELPYNENYKSFGKPSGFDPVFFSCAACHVGRVNVNGKMTFIPGAPNTEIEAQYYSKLLMETGKAMSLGLNLESLDLILPHGDIKPNPKPALGLATLLLETGLSDAEVAKLYGPSLNQMLRGRMMIFRVISNITLVLKDLIASAIKIHFVYYATANKQAYSAEKLAQDGRLASGQLVPDIMNDRIGQMDAFGIASGLIAIHAIRPDNSFLDFLLTNDEQVYQKNAAHEIFGGFAYFDKNTELGRGVDQSLSHAAKLERMKRIIYDNKAAWQPKVPGPIDIKALFMVRERHYANWDGNQGAEARTLASGTSATGDPRLVNTEIHEPLNPFINNLPPKPYPFPIDIAKATKGRQVFKDKNCENCHAPKNDAIYSDLGMDKNRSMVNSSVSRTLLAGLVLESCSIYSNNHKGQPGADFCKPSGTTSQEKLANYFEDVPGRVENSRDQDPNNIDPNKVPNSPDRNKPDPSKRAKGLRNGYKADTLHGIWSQAPYFHNGSVPTLGQVLCVKARPKTFKRGNVDFDKDLVGFEWAEPGQRHTGSDLFQVKTYDTSYISRSNAGHDFGGDICPDGLDKLDPVKDRKQIADMIRDSKAGDLVEYLKTF